MALPLTQLESSVDPHCRGQHKPAARRPGGPDGCGRVSLRIWNAIKNFWFPAVTLVESHLSGKAIGQTV